MDKDKKRGPFHMIVGLYNPKDKTMEILYKGKPYYLPEKNADWLKDYDLYDAAYERESNKRKNCNDSKILIGGQDQSIFSFHGIIPS